MQLTIGDTVIPYLVRESDKATCKKIVVTPAGVEVVVPFGTPLDGPEGIVPYIQRKRRWVFDSVREVQEKHRALLTQQYGSGAKLQYRGRWLMLDVKIGNVAQVSITFRSKFHVVVPVGLDEFETLESVREALDRWLRERALDEMERFGHEHEATLGVQAAGYRLSEARSRWGSCGRDGVVRVHWRLVQAPTAALEYVVAHEVAHLLHRNHSPEFWAKMIAAEIMDWPTPDMCDFLEAVDCSDAEAPDIVLELAEIAATLGMDLQEMAARVTTNIKAEAEAEAESEEPTPSRTERLQN